MFAHCALYIWIMLTPDLNEAAAVVEEIKLVVEGAIARFSEAHSLEDDQVVAYDLAHAASALAAARSVIDYGARGDVECRLAVAFIADVAADVASKAFGRESYFGSVERFLAQSSAFVAAYRDPSFLSDLAETPGDRHLAEEFEMVQDAFRRFADERIAPHAEHVHRHNLDVPEEIITGLGEMGAFGLSIPEEYGGFASGDSNDYIAMVVATEELSRASLGIGGSLITRPEILARALLRGGTEEQKKAWLPQLASGEVMNAVAVTEPDFGSDVASITTSATKVEGGWVINGVKTWCTFAARANVLMLLARTDADRSKAHRGLSLFMIPKEQADGHGFLFTQEPQSGRAERGRLEARAIDTLGYRGMHSYEVAIENWFVTDEHLVGGESGLGRGFYFQMEGFENGRIQTAARAVGVMQSAYESALEYARNRTVFGKPIIEYQLTRTKLGRMAAIIQASRQFSYHVANLMAKGEGALEASMVKAYVCKATEWVTREALQIHGGMGYAEEFKVSRLFVDARVLSIFEGADETLALKVIARKLLEGDPRS